MSRSWDNYAKRLCFSKVKDEGQKQTIFWLHFLSLGSKKTSLLALCLFLEQYFGIGLSCLHINLQLSLALKLGKKFKVKDSGRKQIKSEKLWLQSWLTSDGKVDWPLN